jgi:hypothetical protein
MLSPKTNVSDILERGYYDAGYQGAMNLTAGKMGENSNQISIRAIWIARFYAYAGKKNPALKWLRMAFEERDPFLVNLGVSRDWDSLRGEPRFQDLLRQMNFPKDEKIE